MPAKSEPWDLRGVGFVTLRSEFRQLHLPSVFLLPQFRSEQFLRYSLHFGCALNRQGVSCAAMDGVSYFDSQRRTVRGILCNPLPKISENLGRLANHHGLRLSPRSREPLEPVELLPGGVLGFGDGFQCLGDKKAEARSLVLIGGRERPAQNVLSDFESL